jgi:F-type H+-transporting ATPase subunit b
MTCRIRLPVLIAAVVFGLMSVPFPPGCSPIALGADEHGRETSVTSATEKGGHGDSHANSGESHGTAQGEPPNVLSVDPDLAICTFIVFAVLLAILWKFAWGPISEALHQREHAISENIAQAERQNQEARRLLAEHEAKLAGAASEMRKMLDDAKRDAESQKQQILAEAQTAASAEKERALREIGAAKDAAIRTLAERSVDTAVDLAGKIVGKQLSRHDHIQLIGDALGQFPGKN